MQRTRWDPKHILGGSTRLPRPAQPIRNEQNHKADQKLIGKDYERLWDLVEQKEP